MDSIDVHGQSMDGYDRKPYARTWKAQLDRVLVLASVRELSAPDKPDRQSRNHYGQEAAGTRGLTALVTPSPRTVAPSRTPFK